MRQVHEYPDPGRRKVRGKKLGSASSGVEAAQGQCQISATKTTSGQAASATAESMGFDKCHANTSGDRSRCDSAADQRPRLAAGREEALGKEERASKFGGKEFSN